MNRSHYGDSYDLVKRFFCLELAALGYAVTIDPMLSGTWNGDLSAFYQLIGVLPRSGPNGDGARVALFIDPDTGVNEKGGKHHVSYRRLSEEASRHSLVFSFDQAFSRASMPSVVMRGKLDSLAALGCHGMFYDSHARFLFAANERSRLDELRTHLTGLGVPAARLVPGTS